MDGVQQVTNNYDVIEYNLRRVFTDIQTILKFRNQFNVSHCMVLTLVFVDLTGHIHSKMQYACF